jgi:hypothetical protein
MKSRLWMVALAGAVAGLLAVGGFGVSCGGGDDATDSGTDDGGGDDGTGRVEPNPTDGVRADFVINELGIGDMAAGEGFNLDGINTPPGDPFFVEDGPGGIDNQLGALIGAIEDAGVEINADQSIRDGLADGSLIILLSHRDIDSWTNDPGLVYLYGYAGKDADIPEDPTNNFSGTAQFLIDELSLEPPYDNEDEALIYFDNGILNDTTAADTNLQVGDFTAGPSLFQVDIPVQDTILRLAINGTRIVWDIGTVPTGDPALNGEIINGMLGGYILLADAAAAIGSIDLGGTIDPSTLRTILSGQADMDVVPEGFADVPCSESTSESDCLPGQLCESDETRGGAFYCYETPRNPDAISLALTFSAVSCEITGIWHDTSGAK